MTTFLKQKAQDITFWVIFLSMLAGAVIGYANITNKISFNTAKIEGIDGHLQRLDARVETIINRNDEVDQHREESK